MSTFDLVLADLDAESADLDGLVAGLDDAGWAAPTPAEGWTVAHQIAHLAWTDRAALLAVTDPDGFALHLRDAVADPDGFALHLRDAVADPDGFVDAGADEGAALPPAELLADWRAGRDRLAEALRGVPAGVRLSW